MTIHSDVEKVRRYLDEFCVQLPTRTVGTQGNRVAGLMIADTMRSFGFNVETPEFDCLDWRCDEVSLSVGDHRLEVTAGPFTLPCDVTAELCSVSSIAQLRQADTKGKIILAMGELVKEQLIPKSFTFYNPPEHQEIHALLEKSGAAAIVAATSRDPQLAGGMYPFPFIEDGDFAIPSAYMKDTEGEILRRIAAGKRGCLRIRSQRIPARGFNVVARKGNPDQPFILLCAHYDSKPSTPGAIDNATGVIVLLLLAEMLQSVSPEIGVELVGLNGEDYYSIPGQMLYLSAFEAKARLCRMVINMDGAGYHREKTAYSLYNAGPELEKSVETAIKVFPDMIRGPEWINSDHGMFIPMGLPTMAVTSFNMMEVLSRDITHTPRDNPQIVDDRKVGDIAKALFRLISNWNG
ncbi:MAG: M28 family peptidase [Candidatus Delongbacteria bacterium]|nr:M28 family peptidase [Candidatus Delongbacteria bacterium]